MTGLAGKLLTVLAMEIYAMMKEVFTQNGMALTSKDQAEISSLTNVIRTSTLAIRTGAMTMEVMIITTTVDLNGMVQDLCRMVGHQKMVIQ
jgi:hypothetical protein